MFGLLGKTIVGGGPALWAALALGAVLAFGGTFAAGYFYGNERVVTKVIDASLKQIADAKDAGAKAQAAQDAKDADANRADYEARLARETARNKALSDIINQYKSQVPHDLKCVVPGAAMKGLNDPALIGRVQ